MDGMERWERLQYARRRIEETLASLADNVFEPGVKLTFIMRNPEAGNGGMIITAEDEPEMLIEAIRRTWVMSPHDNGHDPLPTPDPRIQEIATLRARVAELEMELDTAMKEVARLRDENKRLRADISRRGIQWSDD